MSKRSGRAILNRLTSERETGPLELIDQRSEQAANLLDVATQAGIDVIAEVFAGTSVPGNPEKVNLLLQVRSEVRSRWTTARDAFLATGRALRRAEQALARDEFVRLRRSSERLFPFSDTVASQLRRIAEAVDEKQRIGADECPGSYSNAYQLILLSDEQLRLARERNLVRPDVTRHEVLAFRAHVKTLDSSLFKTSEGMAVHRVGGQFIEKERARLISREQELLSELEQIRIRIQELIM